MGNRIEINAKYRSGKSQPCNRMLPEAPGTEWLNNKYPWADTRVRRG